MVLGLAILAMIIFSFLRSRGEAADSLLAAAMSTLQAPIRASGEAEPAGDTESFATIAERDQAVLAELQTITEDYPYTKAATIAAYLRGTNLLDLKQFDEAREVLSTFVRDHTGSPLIPAARQSLAEATLEAGDTETALDILTELTENPGLTYPADAALMNLARAQEVSGQVKAAMETYRRLTSEHPDSLYSQAAATAISRLTAPGDRSS